MIYSDEGFVLSAVKYSENSAVVQFFCRNEGLLSALVRSASGKRGISRAYFSPYFLLGLELTKGRHADLATIKEVSGGGQNLTLSNNIQKQALCVFVAELLKNTMESGYSNSELFEFLKERHENLRSLDLPGSIWTIHFILGLIQHLGFGILPAEKPDLLFNTQEGTFSDGHHYSHPHTLDLSLSNALNQLLEESDFSGNKSLNAQLLNMLIDFLQLHIQGFRKPKSLEVFREVFL